MFKFKYIALLLLTLTACKVKKNLQKSSDTQTLEAATSVFKSGLSNVITSTLNGVITTTEYEYPDLTPEQKANGQTEPKPRPKKVTQTTFNQVQKSTTNDSTEHTKTVLKQSDQHKAETVNQTVDVGTAFPYWLIPVVLVVAGLILYWKYGNLFNLAKKLFTKNETN